MQHLDTHFKNLIKQKKIRSASYCIAKHGKIISCKAMGDMDLDGRKTSEVRTDTLFETQSITKWITAAAVLILLEQNQLSLSDRAGRYIKEFNQPPFAGITILHLLTHTSGLVPLEDAFPMRNLNWKAFVNTENVAESWIPAVLKMGLFFEPGSRWEYSMAGFCILGEIIAKITGEWAENFIRREILLPCNMMETHWKREVTPEWAQRYQIRTDLHRKQYKNAQLYGEKAWIDYCADWPEIPETAGGLMSTTQDIVQFGIMLSEGGSYGGRQILQEHTLHYFEKNQLEPGVRDFCWDHGGAAISYGAGCAVLKSGYDCFFHAGEGTMYHEGAGPCMLMVNRREGLAAAWDAPFFTEQVWYAEPTRDTASIIWENW